MSAATLAPGMGPSARPRELEEDMDLRALLPPGPVSVDDTWELAGGVVLDAMPPGGQLGFAEEDDDDDFDFEEAFEGSATATFAGMREEDGLRLAVVVIELQGVAEQPAQEKDGSTQSLTFAVELKYELLWCLAEGRAHSIEVAGGVGAVLSIAQEVEVQGKTVTLEIELELSGPVEMGATFERE